MSLRHAPTPKTENRNSKIEIRNPQGRFPSAWEQPRGGESARQIWQPCRDTERRTSANLGQECWRSALKNDGSKPLSYLDSIKASGTKPFEA